MLQLTIYKCHLLIVSPVHTHTHTHTQTNKQTNKHTRTQTIYLSRTHTHTHTHTHTRTHTHSPMSCNACHLRDPTVRCSRENLDMIQEPVYVPGQMQVRYIYLLVSIISYYIFFVL